MGLLGPGQSMFIAFFDHGNIRVDTILLGETRAKHDHILSCNGGSSLADLMLCNESIGSRVCSLLSLTMET